MSEEMKVTVFLGLSLTSEEARNLLPDADYRPPAARGDLIWAAEAGARIIGLIDGVFYQQAAVAPREILHAIRKGIVVIGGSSMGALRAAELDRYGMIGAGEIYRWYKEGLVNSDDAVAVAFNPETFKTISEPLVNFMATVRALTNRGAISDREGEEIVNSARQLPFQFRNISRVVQKSVQNGIDLERGKDLLRLLKDNWVDQKKLDALEVVKEVILFKAKGISGFPG